MWKSIAFSIIFSFAFLNSNAQNVEIGAGVGQMLYTGDLDPKQFGRNFENLKGGLALHVKYNYNRHFNIRLNLAHGTVMGRDSLSEKEWQLRRNLSFHSKITELGIMGEYNVFGFDLNPESNMHFTPYVIAGIAVYKFNPKTDYLGEEVALQPLGTEGQGMAGYDEKYKLTQIAIPVGGGVKFRVSSQFSVSAEFVSRFLFTDHLDDIGGNYVAYEDLLASNGPLAAQLAKREGEYYGNDTPYTEATGKVRGKPDANDYYMSGMLTLSYHFNAKSLLTRGKVECASF